MNRDEKIKLYNEGLKKILPGLETGGAFSFFSGPEPTSGSIEFSTQCEVLNALFRPTSTKHFIHYTSINSLFEILYSKNIRLYDTNNLNDPEEMVFALRELGKNLPDNLLDFKQDHFVGSFCAFNWENHDDSFIMWKLYGQDGAGVGLVFEVTNIERDWSSAYFGRVAYGKNSGEFNILRMLYDFHVEFNNTYGLFENDSSIFKAFSLFFKNDNWSHENEYRLFVNAPYDKFELKKRPHADGASWLTHHLKITMLRNGKQGAFVEYPLNFFEQNTEIGRFVDADILDRHKNSIPNLKLVRVLAGYAIDEKSEFDLFKTVDHISSKKFGYSVPVCYTRFRQSFK
jgi:hypothetical protein